MLFEKVRFMLGLRRSMRRRAAAAGRGAELQPVIDEQACAWPFTDAAIEASPSAPGIYLLYRTGRLIYIGFALAAPGVRHELESHRRGNYGACTKGATAFMFELAVDPVAAYRRHLEAHRSRYGGRLPPCNERQVTAR